MRFIYPNIGDNPIGADPKVGIYTAVNRAYPEYGLTMDNSEIIACQPCRLPTAVTLKRILIEKDGNPEDRYDFYYETYSVRTIFPSPNYFTAGEINTIIDKNSELYILNLLRDKTGFNFLEEDFWIEPAGIFNVGGEVQPNWLLRAKYNSLWFIDDTLFWLHQGP